MERQRRPRQPKSPGRMLLGLIGAGSAGFRRAGSRQESFFYPYRAHYTAAGYREAAHMVLAELDSIIQRR